jgi:hypothetical protein
MRRWHSISFCCHPPSLNRRPVLCSPIHSFDTLAPTGCQPHFDSQTSATSTHDARCIVDLLILLILLHLPSHRVIQTDFSTDTPWPRYTQRVGSSCVSSLPNLSSYRSGITFYVLYRMKFVARALYRRKTRSLLSVRSGFVTLNWAAFNVHRLQFIPWMNSLDGDCSSVLCSRTPSLRRWKAYRLRGVGRAMSRIRGLT